MEKYFITDLALEKDESAKPYFEILTEHSIAYRNFSLPIDPHERADEPKTVTIHTKNLWELSQNELIDLGNKTGEELARLMRAQLKGFEGIVPSVLVVGLGNREHTSDALGPETVKYLTVTRHLPKGASCGCMVSAVATGVTSQTGIETAELVSGICRQISPHLLLAVDSLAARSTCRLASTIQLSDGGILPGSGLGNLGKALNRQTLKCPVISIGVPTVVHSVTLIADAFRQCGIQSADELLKKRLEDEQNRYVAPKESDLLLKSAALLLALAIDHACALFGGEA